MQGVPLRYSMRNLWRRPVRTLLTLFGLSLLVAVIIFLVAFGRSFGRALRMPGDPQNLIALSKKAQTFELSSIPAAELDLLEGALENELAQDADGVALFSREVYHFVNVRLEADPERKPRRGLLHGIDPYQAKDLLVGFEISDGDLPEEGQSEVLVGRAVADRLRVGPEWVARGKKILVRDVAFTVAGTFKAPGTINENWILLPPGDLKVLLGRRDYSFARLKIKPGIDLDALARRLSLDERYQLRVLRETTYFADFKEGFLHFQRFAVLLAAVLAIGGVLTGMNTMHNAVVGRIREIGTLRVLGFRKGAIFLSFLLEALLLTGLAGVAACLISLLTDGLPVRVPVAASFPVVVDFPALLAGLGAALLMGALGIAYPMYRALSTPAVEAVKAV